MNKARLYCTRIIFKNRNKIEIEGFPENKDSVGRERKDTKELQRFQQNSGTRIEPSHCISNTNNTRKYQLLPSTWIKLIVSPDRYHHVSKERERSIPLREEYSGPRFHFDPALYFRYIPIRVYGSVITEIVPFFANQFRIVANRREP